MHKKPFRCLLLLFFFCLGDLHLEASSSSSEELFRALEIVLQIDRRLNERFPVTFNHLLSTGYFVTHSARMLEAGSIGLGVTQAPPYRNFNLLIQPFSHLELTANYRIFLHCEDPLLGPYGFGNYADRGANVKFAILTPEESLYATPGLAFGIDDFMGSKKFTTYYLVLTQVMHRWGIEASVGWGSGYYTHGPSRGFFGAMSWFPLWHCSKEWVRGMALCAEYDPTNYTKSPHPLGKTSRSPINVGIKYTLADFLELSASYVRGEEYALSGSLRYNLGSTQGLIEKIGDPLPCYASGTSEPLGCYHPHTALIQEIDNALEAQGFRLREAYLDKAESEGERYHLWLVVMNLCYRQERCVRMRLQHLLASLIPSNVEEVVLVLESYGLPCQQYRYSQELLARYATQAIGEYELELLTPRSDLCPIPREALPLFQKDCPLVRAHLSPRMELFLGSSHGKINYDFGLKFSLEGFLPYQWFYECQVSYTPFSTLKHVKDCDFFYPSQLPNVATDFIRYRQQNSFTWDKLYLQKNWNFFKGLFGRVAGGYFQVNYAGIAGEILWYPALSCVALGLEGAVVKKRRYAGLGFQSKLRQFEGKEPVYYPYDTLQQYFFDVYLDFPAVCFFSKISVGQFLARDMGVRVEVTRYFENGVRLTGWMTFTNAKDIMHGETYFNRGVALEVPLDIFFKRSCRRVWNYGMAAWLRDAGYSISAGMPLFDLVNRERRW